MIMLVRLDKEKPGISTEFARTVFPHYHSLLSKNPSYFVPITRFTLTQMSRACFLEPQTLGGSRSRNGNPNLSKISSISPLFCWNFH